MLPEHFLTPLVESYSQLKASCHVDIGNYFHWFPTTDNVMNVDTLKNFPTFPKGEDLLDGILFGLLIVLGRFILTKLFFEPVGKACMDLKAEVKFHKFCHGDTKMRKRFTSEQADVIIENSEQIKNIAKDYKVSVEEVKEFVNLRNQVTIEEKQLHKFSEVSYKMCWHILLTVYGLFFFAVGEGYFGDTKNILWNDYPLMRVSSTLYWYIMAEFGYYIHEFVFFFFEQKRSDDAMMLTHHLATLTLISGSYLMNMTPIATATMIVHDIADSLLEIAKLFNYMKDARPWAEGVSDGVFVSFAIAFITSRCGVFPYKIIYQGLLLSRNITVPAFFALDFFISFLLILQVLHIIWSYMIVRSALKFLKGEELTDERSMVEGLQKSISSLTGEELEKELEDKRIAIAKLDKLSSQTKKNK
jgi:ceramide synthetase